MIYQNFSVEIFPNGQSKTPLVQFEAITSLPMKKWLISPHTIFFLQPPFRELWRAIRAPSEAPFFQSKHPQLPQILLMLEF